VNSRLRAPSDRPILGREGPLRKQASLAEPLSVHQPANRGGNALGHQPSASEGGQAESPVPRA